MEDAQSEDACLHQKLVQVTTSDCPWHPQDAKAMPVLPGTEDCNFTGFFSNWVVGGGQYQSFDVFHWRKMPKTSFFLMSLPILMCFILNNL